jgi:hypothetical protein
MRPFAIPLLSGGLAIFAMPDHHAVTAGGATKVLPPNSAADIDGVARVSPLPNRPFPYSAALNAASFSTA